VRDKVVEWLQEAVDFFKAHVVHRYFSSPKVEMREGGGPSCSRGTPAVFGVTPQGQPALVQSHLYIVPGRPEQGAWLIVQGLWPALELKDSTSLAVRLVRQAPPRPSRLEGSVER
jgi:hypothetical protein